MGHQLGCRHPPLYNDLHLGHSHTRMHQVITSLMTAVSSQKAASQDIGFRLVLENVLGYFPKTHFKGRSWFCILLEALHCEKSSCICGFLGFSRGRVLITAENGSSDP